MIMLDVPPPGEPPSDDTEPEPPEQPVVKRERPASSATLAFVQEPFSILEIPGKGSLCIDEEAETKQRALA